jgi:glycosidase
VDNPHTKPLPFWEWCITSLKAEYPDVLFLAEAFTRPKVMYTLAKGGFTQSYTYFTWRTTKPEFVAYMTELTKTEVAEFFEPKLLAEHARYPPGAPPDGRARGVRFAADPGRDAVVLVRACTGPRTS